MRIDSITGVDSFFHLGVMGVLGILGDLRILGILGEAKSTARFWEEGRPRPTRFYFTQKNTSIFSLLQGRGGAPLLPGT